MTDLVTFAKTKKLSDFQQAFNQVVMAKIVDKIEQQKAETIKNVFK